MKHLSTSEVLNKEDDLIFLILNVSSTVLLIELAIKLGFLIKPLFVIEILIGNWTTFHVLRPGSSSEIKRWICEKVRAVLLKRHSALYERLSVQVRRVDCRKEINLLGEKYTIHGGGSS